jgi:TetR/AcrR family transcriptional regulator, copper-responsive repressor
MVQKLTRPPTARKRGRPRAYDPDKALLRAIRAFWKAGYSGTSLDDLSAATGMNRPSLYAAFGDKRALYLKALDHYWALGRAGMKQALAYDCPLREALMRVYRAALDVYLPEKGDPRGCFAIGTATTEAMADKTVRAMFMAGLRELDQAFEARLRAAQEQRELVHDSDPATLALMASAILHTLAIRSRGGASRRELEELAEKAVALICGGR